MAGSFDGSTFTRALKVAIAMLFYASDGIRSIAHRAVGRVPVPTPFIVLMYHSVKSTERKRFARQMDQVCRLAHPVYADFEPAPPDVRRCIAVTFDDGYHSVLANAFPLLRQRGIPATLFIPLAHIGSVPRWITDERHRDADERLLTAAELRQLVDAGWRIGSHGVTHRPFAELRRAEVIDELSRSRRMLSETLGQQVRLFALPYGSGNEEVFNLAAAEGYSRVFLNVPAQSTAAAHVVGRVEVAATDWRLEYYLKIRGAYRWLPLAMMAKRRTLGALRRIFVTGERRGSARIAIERPRDPVAN